MRQPLLALATSAVIGLSVLVPLSLPTEARANRAQVNQAPATASQLSTIASAGRGFDLSSTRIRVGAAVQVRGTVPPGRSRPVRLQRYSGTRWTTIATQHATRRGSYAFRFLADQRPGVVRLRIFAPRTRIHGQVLRAFVTATQKLTVFAPVAASPGTLLRITAGTGGSWNPAISGNSQVVTFFSGAGDLVPGDLNQVRDVFVFDRASGVMGRITDGNRDSTNPSVSRDGQSVAFMSAAGNLVADTSNRQFNVFVHTLGAQTDQTAQTTQVTSEPVMTGPPVISADGQTIAYVSQTNELTPGENLTERDLFVHERATGEHRRITFGNADTYGPSISGDGRLIAFHSWADNLVPGDRNGQADVFLYDVDRQQLTRITDGNGNSTSPALSADGSYLVFESGATNLVAKDTQGRTDVFGYQVATGLITRLTAGNGGSFAPVASADGRIVAFHSWASNLVPGDLNDQSDVFVLDRLTGSLTKLTAGRDDSRAAAISDDGQVVAFLSDAPDLVPGDVNGSPDIFVWTP